MANYDLYTELDLDKDMPPADIAALLDGKINDFRSRGYSDHSPEVDQLSTARAILGDPYKRDVYEGALYGPDDSVVDVVWLHNLADTTFPPTPNQAAAPSAQSTPDSSASDLSPSVAETREVPFVAESPVIPPVSTPDEAPAAHAKPEPEADPVSDPVSEARPADAADSAEASRAEEKPATGASDSIWTAPAATPQNAYGQNQPGQPGQFGQQNRPGQFGQPGAAGSFGSAVPSSRAATAPTAAASMNLSVAGRTRSQSKAYLACLAIMVLGMIYPLIILFTSDNDGDGVYSILKATMFALAHAIAWVGIAEVIWGVRRIAYPAPEKGPENTTAKNDTDKDATDQGDEGKK
jgi:hypothetical protein